MIPIHITDITDPRVAIFASLTERQLRNRRTPADALFIAESPKVIDVALTAGYEPVAYLVTDKHLHGDAAPLIERSPGATVYTGTVETLSALTGYTMSRGVLCAMRRPLPPDAAAVFEGARRVAVFDGVVDNTNIGAMFRSAAALGIDAVALTHTCCDPLNRRSVRVSMGSVFLVPWTWIPAVETMHEYGFKTVAMALTDRSVALDNPILAAQQRLAIVLGNEGDGLPPQTIAAADFTVKIPMAHGVDSLNVGAAAAVAFWQLRIHNF